MLFSSPCFLLHLVQCCIMSVQICRGHYICLVSLPTLSIKKYILQKNVGVVTCPGIFPMAFTVLWRRQNTPAAILAPVLGLATGLAVWLTTAHHFYGAVTVSSTGQVLPCVYGTVASAFSPIPYSVIITYLTGPQSYDWADFKKERLALEKLDSDLTTTHHVPNSPDDSPDDSPCQQQQDDEEPASAASNAKELKRWGRIAAFWSVATFLGHWVIWPLPMYGSRYIFGKGVRFRSLRIYGLHCL